MNQQFPTKAWRLTASYQLKEVTLVKRHIGWGFAGYMTDRSMPIDENDVWPTRAEAIANGYVRLDEKLARLEEKRHTIEKHRAALDRLRDAEEVKK